MSSRRRTPISDSGVAASGSVVPADASGWPDTTGRDGSVVVPFTDLAPQTREALEADGIAARYVYVGDHEWAYWRLLSSIWAAQKTVLLIEHDIVVAPGVVQALLDCERDWCAALYQMGQHVGTGFGCTKLSGSLMVRMPTVVSRILPQHRSWTALDSIVLGTLRRNGVEEHVHGDLTATHLHYDAGGRDLRPRQPDRRMAQTMRMLYVGTGRYLNGVPTADFDTDDPALVARCLGSGLYVTLPEPEEQAPAPEPVPAAQTDEPAPAE